MNYLDAGVAATWFRRSNAFAMWSIYWSKIKFRFHTAVVSSTIFIDLLIRNEMRSSMLALLRQSLCRAYVYHCKTRFWVTASDTTHVRYFLFSSVDTAANRLQSRTTWLLETTKNTKTVNHMAIFDTWTIGETTEKRINYDLSTNSERPCTN